MTRYRPIPLYPELLTQASGAAGDTILSRNAHGPYARPRVAPADPQTSLQLSWRESLRIVSTRWRTHLTETKRLAWHTWARTQEYRTKLGTPYLPTGQQAFIRCNTIRLHVGATVLDQPPQHSASVVAPLVGLAYRKITPNLVVTFEDEPWVHADGAILVIQVSPVVDPTVHFYAGPYRIAATIHGSSTSPPASPQFFPSVWLLRYVPAVCKGRVRLLWPDGRNSDPIRV